MSTVALGALLAGRFFFPRLPVSLIVVVASIGVSWALGLAVSSFVSNAETAPVVANGVLFGLAFDTLRRRVAVEPRRLALGLALAEHVAAWPVLLVLDRRVAASPRAFAQGTYRHALFGLLLGRLAA